MSWIGRKNLAFIPLHRPAALPPDEPIPSDWPDQILRRVLFDPCPATKMDRSLRAYIHTASSGVADLDAVVLPVQVLDQEDVLPDAFESQLGARLRDQGVHAAALVLLGHPPAGRMRRGDFWTRLEMSDGIGGWAMELAYCLTGIDARHPLVGTMGAFDGMACGRGTHPSAYTKAVVGWLDRSAVARHVGREADYDLHAVGLVQPPPLARRAAVQIGSKTPFYMVEARQKVDQFDAGIPGEGVIVYRVQTTDPHGTEAKSAARIDLLTATPDGDPTALNVDEAFTADSGLTVRVVEALTGGYSVHIEDPTQHLVDRTAQSGMLPAAGPPTACVIAGLGVHNITYRDIAGHLQELWRNAQGGTGATNLTAEANAPAATGTPSAYDDPGSNSDVVVYRSADGHVHSLFWSTGTVRHCNLTDAVGAPKASGDPVGWYTPVDRYHHVIYRSGSGHLHELWWTGATPLGHADLTAVSGSLRAAGDPAAYLDPVRATSIVVYRSVDGHIRRLFWSTGPVGQDDLSGGAGTLAAAGDPVAYYTAHNDAHQVVYRAGNGHLFELFWRGVAPVGGWDLTALARAPLATGTPAAYYSAGTNTKHVVYRSVDGRLHEIWWKPGNGAPSHRDITATYGAQAAADRPSAFTVEGSNTQHVTYRGTDNHIYEVLW